MSKTGFVKNCFKYIELNSFSRVIGWLALSAPHELAMHHPASGSIFGDFRFGEPNRRVPWILLTSDKPENHRFISEYKVEKIETGLSQQKTEKSERRLPLESILLSIPVWAYICTTFGVLYLQYTLITE